MTNETTSAQALKPIAVRSDEGEARWWFGNLAVIKTTADDSGGQLTIVEITAPPGLEVPLHVHYRDDEGFWILEGDVTFEVGDATIEAHAGDYVFGRRDIPHGKEGVDGSSPSEGFAKAPQIGVFCLTGTCTFSSVQWVWSPLWSPQVHDARSKLAK